MQRMPLLVPALVFIIATMTVYNNVPLPVNQFMEANTLYFRNNANYTEPFTVQPFGSVYTDEIEISVNRYLQPHEYVRISFQFLQNSTPVVTHIIEMNTTDSPESFEIDRLVGLDPGTYTIQVNSSFYLNNVPTDGILQAYITQGMQDSVGELLNWSNYQFFLNIFIVVLLFSSICVANEPPDRSGKYGKKPDTEFRTYNEEAE